MTKFLLENTCLCCLPIAGQVGPWWLAKSFWLWLSKSFWPWLFKIILTVIFKIILTMINKIILTIIIENHICNENWPNLPFRPSGGGSLTLSLSLSLSLSCFREGLPDILDPTLPIFLLAGWPPQGIGQHSFTNGWAWAFDWVWNYKTSSSTGGQRNVGVGFYMSVKNVSWVSRNTSKTAQATKKWWHLGLVGRLWLGRSGKEDNSAGTFGSLSGRRST